MKDGQAVRALRVVLVALERQGDRAIKGRRDKPDHQDTVIRTPAWDTMLEVKVLELIFSYKQSFHSSTGHHFFFFLSLEKKNAFCLRHQILS